MDQYCILGRIGEGAHGIVFKAKHVEVRPRCVPCASSRGLRPFGAEICRPRGSLDACPGPICCGDPASSGGIAEARPLAGGLDIPDLGADLCGYLVPCVFSSCPSLPKVFWQYLHSLLHRLERSLPSRRWPCGGWRMAFLTRP